MEKSNEEKYVDSHEQELYKRALKYWGKEAQIEMMIEEASELIVALQHYKRYAMNKPNNESNWHYGEHVCEEIIDVQIMINQIKLMFDKEKLSIWRYQKLCQLVERILAYLGNEKK
jgi:NTP pyrophosphatase (non-canonical NTP hydrolase)